MISTDVTAATYWITNPDNIMRYNHAAGSEFYGFWYELRPNPVGLTPNPDICPEGIPLAEFNDNVAHSNARFGFRSHKYAPREIPCSSYIDHTSRDPFGTNPGR